MSDAGQDVCILMTVGAWASTAGAARAPTAVTPTSVDAPSNSRRDTAFLFIVLPPWIVVEFSLHFLIVCQVEEEGSQLFRDQYQQLIVLICLLCTLFAIPTDVQVLLMTAWGCGPTTKAQYRYSALSGLPKLEKERAAFARQR
jgi:hypothetical protein